MVRIFVHTAAFLRCWKAMGLGDKALSALEDALISDPKLGDVIEGTGGARKMRIQLSGRGKSGGARVIYVDVLEQEHTYLLFAYPKNVQENLTPSQKQMIRNVVDAIRKEGRNV